MSGNVGYTPEGEPINLMAIMKLFPQTDMSLIDRIASDEVIDLICHHSAFIWLGMVD
jgi:hypothetical protein